MIPYNSEIFSSNRVADVMKLIKPKIGIRPIVDGRLKNVREDLESQVLDLANSVAKFLNANLKYTDAAPVECIVPDACIGGITEAAKVDEVLNDLKTNGSYASKGFMKPEGVVVFHIAGNLGFKKTIEKDEVPKSQYAS